MRNTLSSLLLAMLLCSTTYAQTGRIFGLNVETGFNVASGDDTSQDRVQHPHHVDNKYYHHHDHHDWDDDDDDDDWDLDLNEGNFYIGIKPEFVLSQKLILGAGVRFNYTYSQYERNNDKYFYWLYSDDNQTTSYIRLQSLEQHNFWIGIPVEFRFIPRGTDQMGLYICAGTSFTYRLGTRNKVTAYKHHTERYEDDIADQIDHPDNYAMPIWLGVGFQFGPKQAFAIDCSLTYTMDWAQMNSLGDVYPLGFGIHFAYRLPFGNKSAQ